MFKKVLINTIAQVVGKAATASSTLIVTILIGKSLGPGGYGDFTKTFVFIGYFYTLVDFGLNAIVVKLMQAQNQMPLLKKLVALRLVLATFFALAAITIVQILPYNQAAQTGFSPLVKLAITLASLTIVTQALYTSANAYFQKILRYDLSTIAAVGSALAVLATSIIVVQVNPSLLGFTLAYVIGGCTLVLVAYFVIWKKTKIFPLPDFKNITNDFEIIKHAWPVALALLFNLIYFRVDIFILSSVRSSTDVGIYGLAYQFFEASLALPIFFANGIYTHFLDVVKNNPTHLKKTVYHWSAILLLISFALIAFLYFVSALIPLYDARFIDSVLPLRILSLGLPFFFLSAILWHLLIIFGKQKYLSVIYAAGALANISANLYYIPKYGYIAAAIITVASEALILLLLLLFLKWQAKND